MRVLLRLLLRPQVQLVTLPTATARPGKAACCPGRGSSKAELLVGGASIRPWPRPGRRAGAARQGRAIASTPVV